MISIDSYTSVQILVCGVPIPMESFFGATITEINITKSTGFEASSAKVVIAAHREQFATLVPLLSMCFGLSFVITILISTQESIIPLPFFHGVIVSKRVQDSFSGDWKLEITCTDMKFVMKKHRQTNSVLPINMNITPVLAAMFGQYLAALLLLGPPITFDKTIQLSPADLQNGETDFDYIRSLASEYGCLFFVDYGLVHFHSPLFPCGFGLLDCKRHGAISMTLETSAENKVDSEGEGSSAPNQLGVWLPSVPVPSALGLLPPLGVGASIISFLKPWFVRKLSVAVEETNLGNGTPSEGALKAQARLFLKALESNSLTCTFDGVILYPLNSVIVVAGYGSMYDGLYYLRSSVINIVGSKATTTLKLVSNVSNL